MMLPLPPRPVLVLALAMAPASFFLNPPGWVLALMLAPDCGGSRPPLARKPARR